MALDPKLRSSKERPLFIIGAVISTVAWLALLVSIVGAVYGAFILAFVLMAQALFIAQIRGNGVRISQRQLPELYERCKAIAGRLGLDEVPEVYLLQSNGMLNAFATKLLSRRFVVLFSSLVDGCDDPRQLDFVIGHEMGHLAAGHLTWNAFLLPFRLVPWLGPAYSRACEYTCDRAGLDATGGLEPALRGVAVLAAGGRTAQRLDLAAFMEQRQETGGFWMAVLELSSSHPFLCKRAAALQEFVQPGTVRPVPRNALAYPLAPFFSIAAGPAGAGGAMAMIAVIGILAAIAVPNFIKFQERSQAAAARQPQILQRMMQQSADPDAVPASDALPEK